MLKRVEYNQHRRSRRIALLVTLVSLVVLVVLVAAGLSLLPSLPERWYVWRLHTGDAATRLAAIDALWNLGSTAQIDWALEEKTTSSVPVLIRTLESWKLDQVDGAYSEFSGSISASTIDDVLACLYELGVTAEQAWPAMIEHALHGTRERHPRVSRALRRVTGYDLLAKGEPPQRDSSAD